MDATEIEIKRQAIGRANGSPLPGPLLAAFKSEPTLIAGIAVRHIVASDWPRLEELSSPLASMVKEAAQNPQTPADIPQTEQQQWEACWLFTHTPQECREAFKEGIEAFRVRVQDEIGDVWQEPMVRLVYAAVLSKLTESWSTWLKHAAELEEKGEVRFFRDSPANPKTG